MKLSKIFIPAALILVFLLTGMLSGCVPPVPEIIEVTGVDITEEDQSMKVDETLQLTAVVTPEDATNKAITWQSDNPDVATVSENGLVTALKRGTANITVTTEDGSFTDTIKITVIKPTPVPSPTPTPLIKTYEVSFGVYLIPEELPAGLTSRGEDPVPNLAGVEIEIFSDEARTDKVTTITTDENGMATIKLINGTYYFIATGERYICAPMDEIINEDYEVITLPTPITTLTVQGSFTISDEDISDTILIIARDTYIVTFLATEDNTQSSGVSRIKIDPSPIPLEDVTIEIYEGGFRNTATPERTVKELVEEFKITTLTTDSDGMVQVYLPNGPYDFTASKEDYVYSPPDNTDFSVQRAAQKGYFEVIGADIIDDPVPVPMERVYTLAINTDPTDSGTASDDTNTGPYTAGTEVTISAEPADGYEFVNWTDDDNNNAVVSEDASYTFNMPGADVNYTANFISVYEVSFQVIYGIPLGINSRNGVSIDLSGFKIEIFTDAERNTKKTETETENDGTALVKLPNGEYWFRVSKEGYADYPPENNDLSVQRTPNPDPGYFVVDGADVDVTNDSPIFMVHVYNVTMANVVGGTATVTATPDTNVQYLETVTVNISGIESGKEFSSIKVIGSNSASPISTSPVKEGEEYTFTMPTENVTVTVELKDAGCQQAGYIYNGSDYADDWMISKSSTGNTEQSIDGDILNFKAYETEKSTEYYTIICSTYNTVYISDCIKSIEIDWENSGSDSETNDSYLFVTTLRGKEFYESNEYPVLSKTKQFSRTTDTLDVSELNGAYYIQVQARLQADYDDNKDESNITVHSIKLSEDTVGSE